MPNHDEFNEGPKHPEIQKPNTRGWVESSSWESAQSEKDPWENVLLGGFILALGYKLGTDGEPESAFSLNLLQQTPVDQFFGDLLSVSEFRGFLLEFKRTWNGRLAERKKEKFAIISSDELSKEASACHFLGYGASTPKFDLKFGKYLELVRAEREDNVDTSSLAEFLQRIVDHQIGANTEDFRAYFEKLIEQLKRRFESGSGLNKEEANRKVVQLDSVLNCAAIMYTQEGLYTVPFSSIISFGAMMQIKLARELRQKIQQEWSNKIDPPGYSHGISM